MAGNPFQDTAPEADKWQRLNIALRGLFGRARLVADGHTVELIKRLAGERLVIEVYVNGWIDGKWYELDPNGDPVHPEGRFWRPRRGRLWPLNKRRELKRIFGKKKAEEMTALKTICLDPTWTSPGSLIRHLRKHFPDLDVQEVAHDQQSLSQ